MLRSILYLFLLPFLVVNCGDTAPDRAAAPPTPFDKATAALAGGGNAASIAPLLLAPFATVVDSTTGLPDSANSAAYLTTALALSDRYPNDTLAADPLYKAAEVARALGDNARAADIYATVYDRYPTFSKAPESLFMLAFTHDENLRNLDRARTEYERFLANHPDHYFAESAQLMLANLGKSSEEYLRELER